MMNSEKEMRVLRWYGVRGCHTIVGVEPRGLEYLTEHPAGSQYTPRVAWPSMFHSV